MKKHFRVNINADECKGCARCVVACPRQILQMGSTLNAMGVPSAYCAGKDCIGCGCCFYTCPEPGAITVYEIIDEATSE